MVVWYNILQIDTFLLLGFFSEIEFVRFYCIFDENVKK